MTSLIIGIVALLYGLFTIYLRVHRGSKGSKGFSKLPKMKEAYGEKGGTIIHVISYTVVPIIIGVACIIACFLGVDVF